VRKMKRKKLGMVGLTVFERPSNQKLEAYYAQLT
jgi:hypothetical protein